jgi:hypothetical protein
MKTFYQQVKFIVAAFFVLILLSLNIFAQTADTAEAHHLRGYDFHNRRCLDDASREYAQVLKLDPPRNLNAEEWKLVRTFAPRLYTHAKEFFPLKDVAVIVHPTERLIAYHLMWADDVDFPEDNDPSDHEVIWVQYSADKKSLEKIWTYFHGHILEGREEALRDARTHVMRPRVNVQWGKHGSLLVGWEEMTVQQNNATVTLKQYNESTFKQLSKGTRMQNHPLSLRFGWPQKFEGDWNNFISFSRYFDPLILLNKMKMAKVTRWNNATINQHFLPYNFRAKTEWPAP